MADIDDTDLMLIELLQKDARTPQHERSACRGHEPARTVVHFAFAERDRLAAMHAAAVGDERRQTEGAA